MSKLRSVSTAFWSDPFVEELTPNQKLLFLYLITNDKTNMLGIYEVSIRKISFETGIKKDEIEKGLKAFERLQKVNYIENHVILINYMKHQNFNFNMKKSAIDVYNNLPQEIKLQGINTLDKTVECFETLLDGFGIVRKVEVEVEVEVETKEELEVKSKKELEERKQVFLSTLSTFQEKYNKDILNKFFNYWTEKNPSGKKMKFEMQKTFEISKRLKTWSDNQLKFDNNGTTKTEQQDRSDTINNFIND